MPYAATIRHRASQPTFASQPVYDNLCGERHEGRQTIIDILNELLAGELTAVDQYLIHGEMYADMGLHALAENHPRIRSTSASTPAR